MPGRCTESVLKAASRAIRVGHPSRASAIMSFAEYGKEE